MNIIAPFPKKPTSMPVTHLQDEVDDACSELRQILQQSSGYRHYCPTARMDDSQLIPRTNNPLPLDSSFVPLHQAHRPRSLSVCDSRPLINLVH